MIVDRSPGTATPTAEIDAAVAAVRANRDRWVATPPADKVRLLDEVIRATAPVADRWTELSAIHEGPDPSDPYAAEEGIVGPYVFLRGARLHRTGP